MPLNKLAIEEPTVLTKQSPLNLDPEAQMVMGAKALYDALLPEQQNQDDERAALECSLLREHLETLGGRPRWAPHDKKTADALTKVEGATRTYDSTAEYVKVQHQGGVRGAFGKKADEGNPRIRPETEERE